MEISWIRTEHAIYAAIYAVHHESLTVFGTHTCPDGGCEFHAHGYVLTEWGFKDADAPLIRSIARGDRDEDGTDNREWTFYLAAAQEERDE